MCEKIKSQEIWYQYFQIRGRRIRTYSVSVRGVNIKYWKLISHSFTLSGDAFNMIAHRPEKYKKFKLREPKILEKYKKYLKPSAPTSISFIHTATNNNMKKGHINLKASIMQHQGYLFLCYVIYKKTTTMMMEVQEKFSTQKKSIKILMVDGWMNGYIGSWRRFFFFCFVEICLFYSC